MNNNNDNVNNNTKLITGNRGTSETTPLVLTPSGSCHLPHSPPKGDPRRGIRKNNTFKL